MSRSYRIACVFFSGLFVCAAWGQGNAPVPIGSAQRYGSYSGPRDADRACANCGSGATDFNGWALAGSAPQDYTVGYESNDLVKSKIARLISSKRGAKGAGFGTLMQTISADAYRGQRVRFSAQLRPRGVDEGAGLWFRVDGADGKVLAFDNMRSRPVLGTQTWKSYDIVIDVPENGKQIAYGVLLIGKGTLGIDELRFDTVGKDVPTTDDRELPKAPVNLELKQ